MLSLSNIKASRIPNRVNLTFSDGSYLPFFIDDVVKLSLKKNQNIDSEILNLIQTKSLLYLGKEYALRQIAISPKTEKGLSLKLKIFFQKTLFKFHIKDITTDFLIGEIMADIVSMGLINNKDFIVYFIRKNRNKSQSQIMSLLSAQGIKTDEFIRQQLSQNNDCNLIEKFFDKKNINAQQLADFKFRQRIIASLFRRGFNISDIQNSIDVRSKLK